MHPCPCAHCLPAAQAAKLPHSLPWSASVLDFATPSQARQCIWPYRVHHFVDYGLVVRFRLLSTPPLDDAVAFSYGQPVFCPTGTFTPLLVRTLRRTRVASPRRPRFCDERAFELRSARRSDPAKGGIGPVGPHLRAAVLRSQTRLLRQRGYSGPRYASRVGPH